MIIVSQNKDYIVNFNNIETIGFDECNGQYDIVCTYTDGNSRLGKYKSEERAKEVLQEIVQRKSNWEDLKAGQPNGICSFVYEMPED